jgi:hypothetical protein
VKPALRIGAGTVVAIAGIVAIGALSHRYIDMLGDSFWYLAGGREMLARHTVAMTEPFAFSSPSVTWTPHMALSQVVFAIVGDHLGLGALLDLCAAVFAGAVAFAWLYGARRPLARAATLPIALLVVWLQQRDLAARGQVFGDVALVLLLVLLDRLRAGKRVHAAVPIALGAIWMNFHSSAVAAPPITIAYAATLLLLPRAERPPLVPFAKLAALLALGLFVNPLGHRLVFEITDIAVAGSSARVDLFAPPSFASTDFLVAAILGSAAAWLAARARTPAVGWPDAAFLLIWLDGACLQRRHAETLSLVALVVLGRLADAAVGPDARARLVTWCAAATTVIAVVLGVREARTPKDPFAQMPRDAVDAIEAMGLRDNVINPMHWGGYLDWRWRGQRKIFLDGRYQPFQNGVFEDGDTLWRFERGWGEVLDAYDAQTILWESGHPLDRALAQDPAWREVFRGPFSVVYARRETRAAKEAAPVTAPK